MLVYVAGIRAFNDQQLVVPLLKQIYFVGVVCATFLVKQIYFNLTIRLMSVCGFLMMLILWLAGFLGLIRFTFGRCGLSIQFRCFTERCLSDVTISWDLLGIYHFTYVAAMAGNSLS